MGTKELQILKNDELSHVLVYRKRGEPDVACSGILIVKADGEVFDSLIEHDKFLGELEFPMKEGGVTTGEFSRVKALSRLKPKKLALGLHFGVALTSRGKLFKWVDVPKEMVIMVKACNRSCQCGNSRRKNKGVFGGFNLKECKHKLHQRFNTYTHKNPPPPGVAVWQFVRSDFKVSCFMCGIPYENNNYEYGGSLINKCSECHAYAEVTQLKIPYELDSGVTDVDTGETFICSLYDDFKVKLHFVGNNETTVCQLPEGEMAQSVSCGINHFAVTTKAGNLYSYGDLEEENIRASSISPRKLIVSVRALEVRCWERSTACLLEDKTVCVFENGVPSRLITAPWFYNCSIKPMMEELYKRSMIRIFQRILGQESEAFWNSSVTETALQGSTASNLRSEPVAAQSQTINLHPNQKKLYGEKRLSDLTIKLADEDFPAHWVILISTSQYFQKIVGTENNPSTLDMTSYNPRAYRCLLQHFYQVPPNELPVSDLLDLLELATSYEEPNILEIVTDSLKSLIQVETALKILTKARSLANQDLIKASETFVRSPTFKDYIAEMCLKDPAKCDELTH